MAGKNLRACQLLGCTGNALPYFFRRTSVAKIPDHDDRRRVVLRCSDQSSGLWLSRQLSRNGGVRHITYIIRMPGDGTHASSAAHRHPTSNARLTRQSTRTAAIRQCDDLPLSTQIPYDSVSSAAGASKDVLNLLIPCYRRDLIQFRAARSWSGRVWLAWIFQIPDVHLSQTSMTLSCTR